MRPSFRTAVLVLILAPLWGWAESVEELFERGSPTAVQQAVADDPGLLSLKLEGNLTVMHLAARRADSEICKILLQAGYPVKLDKGWTPLHEAALTGRAENAVLLINAGAPVDGREPNNQGTPLHVACFNGRLSVVKVLLGAGAKVNARDRDGWTPLANARDQGFPAIMSYLREHGGK